MDKKELSIIIETILVAQDIIRREEREALNQEREHLQVELERKREDIYEQGHEEGYSVGYDMARDDAYDEGHQDGRQEGYDEGYDDGYVEGVQSVADELDED